MEYSVASCRFLSVYIDHCGDRRYNDRVIETLSVVDVYVGYGESK